MAFLLADRRGPLTKSWRIRSMFSGVLSEGYLPGVFRIAADPVSLNVLPHNSTVLRLGHGRSDEYWSADEISAESQRQHRCSEIRLHSESPMLYRPALHCTSNWNALSLARRALKDKVPTPTVPLIAVLSNLQVFLPDPVFILQPPTYTGFVQYSTTFGNILNCLLSSHRCHLNLTLDKTYRISFV
jgi:hypothetical protein